MTTEKMDLAEDLTEEVTGGTEENSLCTSTKKVFKEYREKVPVVCTMKSKFIRNTAEAMLPGDIKEELRKI